LVAHPQDTVDVLKPDGFALGVIESPTFEEMLEVQTVELQAGDRLLIFTDGLTEAMNSTGEEFGMQRILDIMKHPTDLHGRVLEGNGYHGHLPRPDSELTTENACGPSLSIFDAEDLKVLDRAVEEHVGSEPQSDDLTIVYLGVN
jgi:serine phosphatase RsbU (regulator of sigma subunit)